MTPCKLCDGAGYVVGDDGEASTCKCKLLLSMIQGIRRIPGLENVKKLGRGCLDSEGPMPGSLVVRAEWREMPAHVAGWVFAAARRGKMPKVLLTSCSRLRGMYFGNDESTRASKLSRLTEYDIVVVRLVGIKNKATPEALLEALDFAPAVWLVHTPGHTYRKGHPAWSPEIAEEVATWRALDLGPPDGDVLDALGLGGAA